MLLILDFVLSEVLPRIKIEEYPERPKKKGRPTVQSPEDLGDLELAIESVRTWLTETSRSPWWKRNVHLGSLY
jgi:hypothetical protein